MSNEITADDIAQYLSARDDFDLELFAERTLESNGWDVTHGGTYPDPVTGKFRQFDIRAKRTFSHGRNVFLCVECKSLSRENPLVVSRVARPESESYHHLISLVPRPQIGDTVPRVARCDQRTQTLYSVDARTGKSMTQISKNREGGFRTSDSDTYDRWSQALASSAPLIREIAHTTVYLQTLAICFFMPILLVSDETLWVVDYQADGTRGPPRQENEAIYFVDRACDIDHPRYKGRYCQTHLHIHTRVGFERLIQKLGAPDSFLMEKIFGEALKAPFQ